jgi:hypothetical protein
MDWDLIASAGFLICFGSGIYCIAGHETWAWSLKRRAYLRNGSGNSLLKYRSWESFLEGRKKGSFLEKVSRRIRVYRGKKMDREIFEAITFLRNLASIEKVRNCSTDSIVEKLSECNGLLQPVFVKMLNLLRVNKPKEAAALFTQKVGTPASRDFAGLLIQWDRLEPGELLETLLSYEKSMKAVRLTDQKKRDEIISDLIYLPVVINILVIFINFIYVAYFIDQKEMLQVFL